MDKIIKNLNAKYPEIVPQKYVIMPNHIHLLLSIQKEDDCVNCHTISTAVGWIKYQATKEINEFNFLGLQKIFQRSFHDHIVRDEKDYINIRNYIELNPLYWEKDCFYRKENLL